MSLLCLVRVFLLKILMRLVPSLDASEFLGEIFKETPTGFRIEIRAGPAGLARLIDIPVRPGLNSPTLHRDGMYGVCPRDTRGLVPIATTIWADVDLKNEETRNNFDPANIYPDPSIILSSGGGYHLYWILEQSVDSPQAVRLAKLLVPVVHGDPAVCEPKRILRLPGTVNTKYDPPREVTVVSNNGARYSQRDLLKRTIAALVVPFWEAGARHALALAIGAVFARASWEEDDVSDIIREVCLQTRDSEVNDRIAAAMGTIRRRSEGTHVSASALRDALGGSYAVLLDAIGVTSSDGAIIKDGLVIGHMETVESDLVKLILKDE